MPSIQTMKVSKFLKRDDVGDGMKVTIREVTEENVAMDGAPSEMKWCAHFDEVDKPLVLNWTNLQIIAGIAKDEDTDNWSGVKIVLYDDPNVSFGGKLVGGIRVRAPKANALSKPSSKHKPEPPDNEDDSDVPF